tara:strand:- start:9560 stop:10270 length:711 start_codon:yes stop_codon:yes gene_type:complete
LKIIFRYFVIFIFFKTLQLNSQRNEIGFLLGGSNYIGDVGPTTYIDPISHGTYSLGILYRNNFSDRFSLRTQISISEIGSSDLMSNSPEYRKLRGKSFKNNIQEITAGVDFNFTEFDVQDNKFQFSTYISTGISYFRYDEIHYPIGNNIAQSYGKSSDFAVPITLGIKSKLFKTFVLGLEITARHTFTENLDGSYPTFENTEIYSQKRFGSSLSQDWIVFSGFTLTYVFGNYECKC